MGSDAKTVVMPVRSEPVRETSADSTPPAVGGDAGGNGGDKDLTPQQLQAISLLLEGTSKTRVAEILGVHRTTVQRWFSNAAFMEAYESAVEDLCDAAQARALSNCSLAIDTLVEVMEEYPKRGAAVSAAVAVLRMSGLDKKR